jgi:hypothetical protein
MLSNEKNEAWGGPWTTKKLDAFEDYVKEYLKIMRFQKHWKSIYFDGFAGSGLRKSKSQNPSNNKTALKIADYIIKNG